MRDLPYGSGSGPTETETRHRTTRRSRVRWRSPCRWPHTPACCTCKRPWPWPQCCFCWWVPHVLKRSAFSPRPLLAMAMAPPHTPHTHQVVWLGFRPLLMWQLRHIPGGQWVCDWGGGDLALQAAASALQQQAMLYGPLLQGGTLSGAASGPAYSGAPRCPPLPPPLAALGASPNTPLLASPWCTARPLLPAPPAQAPSATPSWATCLTSCVRI